MTTRKNKVGIIGCGGIFKRHIEAIEQNNKYFELAAICDIEKKCLEINTAGLQVPGFLSHKDMLEKMRGKMNFIVVATPNSFHYSQAMDALNYGCDVLIEKPVAFEAKRVKEISDIAKKLKRNAYVVLQVRYNPTIIRLREFIKGNDIGEVISVSLIQRWQRPPQYFESWRADKNIGGRTLYEVGIHYIDIMQLLFGKPSVITSATFCNKHKYIKFEDTIFSILRFPSGASGSLEVTVAAEPRNLECSLAILTSKGYIKIGGKALDKIEEALFSNLELSRSWDQTVAKTVASEEPNSYGAYSGSCPNHPTLYREIAKGRGIECIDTIPTISLIEEIYRKEVK